MKRIWFVAAGVLLATVLIALSVFGERATLRFKGKWIDDDTFVTQTLTPWETRCVKGILASAEPVIGATACLFDEDVSLSVGGQVYAIACDECNMVKGPKEEEYYEISDVGRAYIVSLFEKYVGYFPYPDGVE